MHYNARHPAPRSSGYLVPCGRRSARNGITQMSVIGERVRGAGHSVTPVSQRKRRVGGTSGRVYPLLLHVSHIALFIVFGGLHIHSPGYWCSSSCHLVLSSLRAPGSARLTGKFETGCGLRCGWTGTALHGGIPSRYRTRRLLLLLPLQAWKVFFLRLKNQEVESSEVIEVIKMCLEARIHANSGESYSLIHKLSLL